MKYFVYISILAFIFSPSLAWAESVFENSNSSSVTNKIMINANSGGNETGSRSSVPRNNIGNTKVEIKIETEIDGEKVIDEELSREGEDLNITIKSEVKKEVGEDPVVNYEASVNGAEVKSLPKNESSKVENENIQIDQDMSEGSRVEKKKIHNQVEHQENASVKTNEGDKSEQTEIFYEDISIQSSDSRDPEKGGNEDNAKYENNILLIIAGYFVDIFHKIFKVFTS